MIKLITDATFQIRGSCWVPNPAPTPREQKEKELCLRVTDPILKRWEENFQLWQNYLAWFVIFGSIFKGIILQIKIHSRNSLGTIKLVCCQELFPFLWCQWIAQQTSPPFCTLGWKTNQYLFTKDRCNNQRCLLEPKSFFHLIILWGDAILYFAIMHSYQCGSAKFVIKRRVINLMLVAHRQNNTALIF